MDNRTLQAALKIVKEKKNINLSLNQCRWEVEPPQIINTCGAVHRFFKQPRLTLNLTVTNDHGSWNEFIDLEYVIFGNDLTDKSLVDKVIGGDLSNYTKKDREILRLAFILYNGIKYGVDREVRQKDIEVGWHPRVVNISMRYI